MTLPALVFCDTSFFYACLDPKDANHMRARILVAESASVGTTFCTTWDSVSETVTLLRFRRNFRAALAFLSDVKPGLQIVPYGDRVRDEAEHLFRNLCPRSSLVFLRCHLVHCGYFAARSCSLLHVR